MTTKMHDDEISNLEKKIEEKIRPRESSSKKSFRVDLKKVKELAEKLRNYESQAHANTLK